MRFEIDPKTSAVSFAVDRGVYTPEAVRIAAHVLSSRADVLCAENSGRLELTLRSRRPAQEPALRDLAGEFANELLNQEYRFLVGRFNKKISDLVVTQALLSCRGAETPAAVPGGEDTPEFKADVAALLARTREEIARTMPKRIAPQGSPIPPAPEERGG